MVPDDDPSEFDEEAPRVEDTPEYRAAREEITRRCQAADLPCEEEVDEVDGEKFVSIAFRCGREQRHRHFFGLAAANRLLSVPFEKYVFLGDYEAICSYSDGTIEAATRILAPAGGRPFYRQFFARRDASGASKEPAALELRKSDDAHAARLRFGPCSEILLALSSPLIRSNPPPSLLIASSNISQHDEALDLLERVSSSLFLQIDLTKEVPIALLRQRRPTQFGRRRRDEGVDIEFPRTEYDKAPLSLYWYGRSATGMPLLQYLAYYQVIEYYFPAYSQAEAVRRVRHILKSPTFRTDRDTDVVRVVSAAALGGPGHSDERSQLRATLQECLNPDALRAFLTEDEARKGFYASKAKGLTEHRLPIANPTADLRNDVADRIYDIRCKIVHTKSGGRETEVELLLPFSKEAELLYADIELIRYVAKEVLVSASSPLRW